jgi:hypothetical protein
MIPPQRQRRHARLSPGCLVVLGVVIILFIVAIAIGAHERQQQVASKGSDYALWQQMSGQIRDHLQAGADAERAGNFQGAATARTKLVADCREAGSYQSGSTDAEVTVRRICGQLGYPLR